MTNEDEEWQTAKKHLLWMIVHFTTLVLLIYTVISYWWDTQDLQTYPYRYHETLKEYIRADIEAMVVLTPIAIISGWKLYVTMKKTKKATGKE